MATVQSTRPHNHQHHHNRRRAEASSPATSMAVAAARAEDAPRHRPRATPVQVREHDAQQQQQQQLLRRSAAFPPRRQPLRRPPQRCDSDLSLREHRSCSEVAGGTAAGCAAVCCCFPCVMVEVVVLATVRAPAALCRRAARVRRGRRRSASAGQATEIYEILVDDGGVVEVDAAGAAVDGLKLPMMKPAALEESTEIEKEVWARFYGAGFWRSPSNLSEEDSR